jgi:hypothetical protein
MTAPVELDLRARRKEQTDSLTTAVALPGTRKLPSGSVRFKETDHDDLQDLYGALETASSPRVLVLRRRWPLGTIRATWIPGCGLQRGFTLLLLISLTNFKQNYSLYLEVMSS